VAFVDIVFSGLGWISITGRGHFKFKTHTPKGCTVVTRDPLMPYESILGLKKKYGKRAMTVKRN